MAKHTKKTDMTIQYVKKKFYTKSETNTHVSTKEPQKINLKGICKLLFILVDLLLYLYLCYKGILSLGKFYRNREGYLTDRTLY